MTARYDDTLGPASGSVYKPTSLDFINRPNPVEPQSAPQKHPLNGTPQVTNPSNENLLRHLVDQSGNVTEGRPAKRRKSGDGKSLDLPKLPLRHSTKRLRIPPTLSGLHQPPPDAGLLPSISTEQPMPAVEKPAESYVLSTEEGLKAASGPGKADVPGQGNGDKTSKHKRRRWSDEETACLLKGVARFGIGNWTKILKCEDYSFESRTALDLKDRFRVCCPDHYQRTKKAGSTAPTAASTIKGKRREGVQSSSKPVRSDRKSNTELQELGINQPFAKVKRRKRHGYSPEEDEAILKGFQRHGNAWAAIKADEELYLDHRTATDLRDRLRTRYPDEYARAGLAPRPDVFPKPPERDKRTEVERSETQESTQEVSVPQSVGSTAAELEKASKIQQKPAVAKKPPQAPLLPYDSVFWGAPFEFEDLVAERITLDRGILDWPGVTNTTRAYDDGRNGGFDVMHAFNPPRPPTIAANPTSHAPNNSALPSVAAITAVGNIDPADQLELPSLMLGPFETDGRAGGHFLGFDELLS